MFKAFTLLADYIVYDFLRLSPQAQFTESLHFFIEDVTKIFFLLAVMVYAIALLRASLNVDRVRNWLAGKHRILGYLAGAAFGAVTPFCSCSSIPIFLGFTSARIPIGITMAFLITSPMINEVAIVLLGSLLGIKFTLCYVTLGLLSGIIGGAIFDIIKAEKHLTDLVLESDIPQKSSCACNQKSEKLQFTQRHDFAKNEVKKIYRKIWKWILLGIGVAAFFHGYVPEKFITENLGSGQWWSVPAAVLLGIPLYANASGIIPIAESLLEKGLPIGTTIAFMMSTVAASFPEFVMLKQVMKPRLLVVFFLTLLTLFTLAGWLFNFLWV